MTRRPRSEPAGSSSARARSTTTFWPSGTEAGKERDVAILRLEQLYPWPADELKQILDRYRSARDWAWVQEESHRRLPANRLSCASPAVSASRTGSPLVSTTA